MHQHEYLVSIYIVQQLWIRKLSSAKSANSTGEFYLDSFAFLNTIHLAYKADYNRYLVATSLTKV